MVYRMLYCLILIWLLGLSKAPVKAEPMFVLDNYQQNASVSSCTRGLISDRDNTTIYISPPERPIRFYSYEIKKKSNEPGFFQTVCVLSIPDNCPGYESQSVCYCETVLHGSVYNIILNLTAHYTYDMLRFGVTFEDFSKLTILRLSYQTFLILQDSRQYYSLTVNQSTSTTAP
jgi:hypothetical protein